MAIQKPIDLSVPQETCVLVGIELPDETFPLDASLDELERLADTAGARAVGRLTQRLDHPHPKTFLGSGKVQELREMVDALDADVIIFDNELSPSQQANLEKILGWQRKIIDRTALILDIFGLHAVTHEGKLQVQLAQLQYLYPRLRGMWAHLAKDRTRGGIGSRFGQGESQLEVDRRLIRSRMTTLREELSHVDKIRSTQRRSRYDSTTFKVSFAGYTNAGKSTLLNALTGSDVYVMDQLFATLDATTRSLRLEGGRIITLSDTVGFVRKLPTNLVESFKSTLAEISNSDLILKVVDSSDPQFTAELEAVDSILEEIGAHKIPFILVFNKCDALDEEQAEALRWRYPQALHVSAIRGDNLDALMTEVVHYANASDVVVQVILPFDQGSLLNECHSQGTVKMESYENDGVHITVALPPTLAQRVMPYAAD